MSSGNLRAYLKPLLSILCRPVYVFSVLFPRDPSVWVFGSNAGRQFADNPKYFYLYLSSLRGEGIRAVWLSLNGDVVSGLKARGYAAFHVYSLAGIYHALRGKVWVFDHTPADISYWLSGGAMKVNLWHGTPLKKIRLDDKNDRWLASRGFARFYNRVRYPSIFEKSDRHIATSSLVRTIFASAFGVTEDRILLSGYPRNDVFAGLPDGFEAGCDAALFGKLSRLKRERGVRVVTYMPTFRDGREHGLFDLVDPEALRALLESMNACLLLKYHPQSKAKGGPDAVGADRVFHVSPGSDVYPFLTITDVLATDYSSVYFDFLLTGRPILFFPYDLADYLRGEREMYFDYNDFTPGPKARDGAEFIEALKLLLAEPTAYAHEREALKRLICAGDGAGASERLYKALSRRLVERRAGPNAGEAPH